MLHQAVPSGPFTASILAGGEATDGAYAVIDIRARAGFALPRHVLCRDEASLVVLAGSLDIDLGDERLRLQDGDQAVLPAGVPRSLHVVADARMVAVVVPAGLERLLAVSAPALPDPDDLAAHLAAAGVTLLPPAGSHVVTRDVDPPA